MTGSSDEVAREGGALLGDWPHGQRVWVRTSPHPPHPHRPGCLPTTLGLGPGSLLSWGPTGGGGDVRECKTGSSPRQRSIIQTPEFDSWPRQLLATEA